MRGIRNVAKYVSCFVTLTMFLMSMPVQTVGAAMIGTETVMTLTNAQQVRKNLNEFLSRADVRAAMISKGISPIEAKARVESLSDAEIMQIADKMDQLPSGGSDFGVLVGAVLVVFVVLLITDILGYTNVFSFVRHPAG